MVVTDIADVGVGQYGTSRVGNMYLPLCGSFDVKLGGILRVDLNL